MRGGGREIVASSASLTPTSRLPAKRIGLVAACCREALVRPRHGRRSNDAAGEIVPAHYASVVKVYVVVVF